MTRLCKHYSEAELRTIVDFSTARGAAARRDGQGYRKEVVEVSASGLGSLCSA